MDALWSVEDKLKISTDKAVIALVCTATLAIALCTITIVVYLKRVAYRNNQIASHDSASLDEEIDTSLIRTSRSLRGPGCWSGAQKWDCFEDVVVRSKYCWLKVSGSNNLPVWQRPILMGEKCQLPGFSGLILYDDKGRPLPQYHNRVHSINADSYNQVEAEELGRAPMLKDLL